MILDVDHHLDAREMSRKGATIDPAPGGAAGPLGRIGRLGLGLAARRELLDVLEPEQHLIFGQRLGASAKAMTLQFLDDRIPPA